MMVKELGKKWNNQRGSATIEAVIGFTAFLFAIFTILGMVNFCRAQMLVSAAVDTAAKEMSQYAYFYEMSGLKKFEKTLDANASVGKNNVNEVIGTVDQLYGSITGAVEQTAQEKTNVANMIAAGEADLTTFENSISNLENSANSVLLGINSVSAAIGDIGNNPMLYMRSIVALIGSEGMEAAKRAVAVPLAKAFVSKHFGDSTKEANKNLEALGIEGGLDSMNFNLSNIFSDKEQQDIEINVIYKVKLLQVFDWVVLEANVSKVALCRAWLGGDDVITKAVATEQPSLSSGTAEGESGAGETTENTETKEETTEKTEPAEGTETTPPAEETPAKNTSTGNWAMQHDPTGYHHSKRCEAFLDQFENDYLINDFGPGFYYRSTDGKAEALDFDVYATWNYDPYDTIGGNVRDPGAELLQIGVLGGVKEMANEHKDQNGKVQEFGMYTHVVYIPENMPQDQYEKLLRDAATVKANMEAYIKEDTTGIPKDLQVNITIVRGGGQYDYNSKESDYVHIGEEG